MYSKHRNSTSFHEQEERIKMQLNLESDESVNEDADLIDMTALTSKIDSNVGKGNLEIGGAFLLY